MIDIYFKYDLIIPVARDFDKSFTFYLDKARTTPVNLSNITFTCQIRSSQSLSSTLIGTLTCTDNGDGGAVTMKSARADNIDWPAGKAHFDLLANDGTDQKTWVYGEIDIPGSVTVNA